MGHVAMMGTALFFAGSYLFAKHLTNRVSAETVVIMLSIFVTIGLFPLAYKVWVPPRLDELIILFGRYPFLGGMFRNVSDNEREKTGYRSDHILAIGSGPSILYVQEVLANENDGIRSGPL